MRFFEKLNTPIAVATALVFFLVIDAVLFYFHSLLLNSTDGALPSSPQQDSLTITSLLLALLILGVINVIITLLTLLSARRIPTSEGRYAEYRNEERQRVEEEQNSNTQKQVDELAQGVLKLQQDYKELAEDIARLRELYLQSERERERIIEGLQNIQQVLVQQQAANTSESRKSRPHIQRSPNQFSG